ncbi:MAG: hypothetical protein H5U40_01580 [Polyangiaceae bacterium]|nr:hypothetical protein [Polyangiaceae bacterium]
MLGGGALLLVGTWAEDPPLSPLLRAARGFEPVELIGQKAGVLWVSDFDEPPAEMPVRYREVIAAVLCRRGLALGALPFEMVLDATLPTELGHLHYGLPKRFDAEMRVSIDTESPFVHAEGVRIEARVCSAATQVAALPLRAAFAIGARLFTATVPAIGAADPPARRAFVALRPSGLGRAVVVSHAEVGGVALRPLFAVRYAHVRTRLGAPRLLT